jgi:general stress protein YciG
MFYQYYWHEIYLKRSILNLQKNNIIMTRNSNNRGFASMDRDQRRQISSMGGRASHGGQREQYNDSDYDTEDNYEDYDQGYEDEDYDTEGSYDEGDNYENRGYNTRGYNNDYESRGSSRYESDYDGGRQHNGGAENRGFASMDRDEVRRIASMGGRAAHERGTAHEWDSEEAREAGHRGGQSSHGGGRQSSYSDRGSRYQDEDRSYDGGRSSSSWGRNEENDNYRSGRSSGGGRGFASMDRDEVRRIASEGGRASHGDRGYSGSTESRGGGRSQGSSSRNEGYSSSRRSGSSDGHSSSGRGSSSDGHSSSHRGGSNDGHSSSNRGSSRRGFAAMSKEQRTQIARKGGEASHGGGRGRSSNR